MSNTSQCRDQPRTWSDVSNVSSPSDQQVAVIYEGQLFDSQVGGARRHFNELSAAFARDEQIVDYQEITPGIGSRRSAPLQNAYGTFRAAKRSLADGNRVVVLSRMVPINLAPLAARIAGAEAWVEINGPMAEEMATRDTRPWMSGLLRGLGRLMERSQLVWARGSWAVTPGLAAHYGDQYSRLAVAAIPNGTTSHEPVSDPKQREPGPFRIIFGGALTPWYDLVSVVAAVEQDERFELLIVGEGQDQHKVLARAEKLEQAGRFKSLGWLPQDELSVLLTEADVAVIPLLPKSSTTEAIGSPLKLFEYLAAGLIVVAPAVDGVAEIEAASLVKYDPSSDSGLADALDFVADNFCDLRTGALQRDPSSHTWETRVDSFKEFVLAVDRCQ